MSEYEPGELGEMSFVSRQRFDAVLQTLAAIWTEALVLNDDDAQVRHQRIANLAHDELARQGVLNNA